MSRLFACRKLICLAAVLVVATGCAGSSPPIEEAPSTRYEDLVALFEEWRTFQAPVLVDGVPDYSSRAMAVQQLELAAYRDRLASTGVNILAITRDPDHEGALAGWRELDVDLPVYFDPAGQVTAALGSFAMPDLLVLDADGRVRFAHRNVNGAARAALVLARDR